MTATYLAEEAKGAARQEKTAALRRETAAQDTFSETKFTAESFIRGENRARQLLTALRCVLGDGDEVLRCVQSCPPDELAGFCRSLQRALEGRAR